MRRIEKDVYVTLISSEADNQGGNAHFSCRWIKTTMLNLKHQVYTLWKDRLKLIYCRIKVFVFRLISTKIDFSLSPVRRWVFRRGPKTSANPPIYLDSCLLPFTISFFSPIMGHRNICYIYCHGAVALTFLRSSVLDVGNQKVGSRGDSFVAASSECRKRRCFTCCVLVGSSHVTLTLLSSK